MAPTLRQLQYLVALAETRHFARAAERCHVTQPALSMQVRELEATLGVKLVERTSSGVLLTSEGEEVVRRGRDILLAVQDLTDFARHRRGRTLAGRLRLGVIPSIGPYLLPRILPRLHAAYPELELSLREAKTRNLVDALAAGALDLLILALPVHHGGIATTPLFDDMFALAVHPDDPLAGREWVEQGELVGRRLLLLEEGHCLRDQALALCHAAPPRDLDDFRASSLATVVQLVINGYGCTILPELALPVELGGHDAGRLRMVRFADPAPARTVGLAWRASSPRKAEYIEFGRLIAATVEAGKRPAWAIREPARA